MQLMDDRVGKVTIDLSRWRPCVLKMLALLFLGSKVCQ